MKRIAMLLFGLALSVPAFAWNCSNPLAERVVVPSTTTGTYGDGNGQLASYNGSLYECEVVVPSTPTTPSTTSNTSNSTSGATSTSTSGANATGGSVNNSGNSSNKNTLSNTNTLSNSQSQSQGQKQSQTQANSSVNSNQSAGGSVSDTGNSSTVVQRSAPMAYAPTIFPSGCNGSISGGASAPFGGISIGGTKQDHHCQQMQTAAMFLSQGNLEAATRILCRTWAARDAKLTLDECRLIAKAQLPVPVVVPSIPVAVPVINPAPIQVTVNVPPTPAPIIIHETMTVVGPKLSAKRKAVHKPCPVTPLQNECPVTREK
jgi:hypothetical protein